MKQRPFALLLAIVLACAAATAGGAEPAAKPMDMGKMWQGALARPALSATASFDADGRLWLATVRDGFLYVRHSEDLGKSYSPPVAVNPTAESIAADGETRPKLAVTKDGAVYVAYTQSLEKPFSGNIRFSRSLDGGKTFSSPLTVNDNRDMITHRFEAMGINQRGQIYLAWLDKRDLDAAAQMGQKYVGAAVYYSVSADGGASFAPNRKLADHSCECCRVALAVDADGTGVAFWRHIYGKNVRDFALARLDGTAERVRVSHDLWQIDACPHHGGAISIGPDGAYHLVWFNNGPERHGLFYASSRDQGKTFSAPIGFGNEDAQAGHPDVLSLGQKVWVAWKEFDGKEAVVQLMQSANGGSTWSKSQRLASAAGASDHPLLISRQGKAYLSWYVPQEGLRLVEAP